MVAIYDETQIDMMKSEHQDSESARGDVLAENIPHTRSPPSGDALHIAVEGCGHGTLDSIYASTKKACEERGWDGVDLLIICGDFQACRNEQDLNMTAMPEKFRKMADFHQYYYGHKTAPYLTIFVGGNHEASNHLFELYYGGWVAPRIYYMGVANVLRLGPLKIAGMSGIWKGMDFRKPHFERLPYSEGTMRSIYHVRELDTRKLLSYRSQVDIGISHDWPQGVEWHGDHGALFKQRQLWANDAKTGKLGNKAATMVMDRLRPPYWFSGHMHWRYTAIKEYHDEVLAARSERQIAQRRQTTALASWNSFGEKAAKAEADEYNAAHQVRQGQNAHATRTSIRHQAAYNLDETYKPVRVDDGAGRLDSRSEEKQDSLLAVQADGPGFSLPLKRTREPSSDEEERRRNGHDIQQFDGSEDMDNSARRDPHAIDLDLSDEEDSLVVLEVTKNLQTNAHYVATDPDAIDLDSSDGDDGKVEKYGLFESATKHIASSFPPDSLNTQVRKSPPAPRQSNLDAATVKPVPSVRPTMGALVEIPNQALASTASDISEEARAALASLSTTFAAVAEKSPDLPHPEAITNRRVNFLALSKVEPGKEFLQLLEVAPFHGPETTKYGLPEQMKQSLELHYDPEWLAILRVFAPELQLDCTSKPVSSTTPAAPHRGDTYYRERILEEERWVEENITQRGRLKIPENFEITATQNSNWNEKHPIECTNPQTTQLCNLIGIPNLFDISHEERQARMEAGPPADDGRARRNDHSSQKNGSGSGGRGSRGGRSDTGRYRSRGTRNRTGRW